MPHIESLETGAAVAAHAERMRLERIRVIAKDNTSPADIRQVFAKILPDEEFHETAFKKMAGQEAMEKTAAAHARGADLIGLITENEM